MSAKKSTRVKEPKALQHLLHCELHACQFELLGAIHTAAAIRKIAKMEFKHRSVTL